MKADKRPSDEIALAGVDWQPVEVDRGDGAIPWVTHVGSIDIGDGDRLRCYQLNDGRRIFDADDVGRFLGLV